MNNSFFNDLVDNVFDLTHKAYRLVIVLTIVNIIGLIIALVGN